jgi:hypothetical protein
MFRDVFGEFSEDGKRVSLDNFQRFLVKEQVKDFYEISVQSNSTQIIFKNEND